MIYRKIHKFGNGATLIYQKHNLNDTTNAEVFMVCGANRDGRHTGMSHLLEHMMFFKTKKLNNSDFIRTIKLCDCDLNALTSANTISIVYNVSNENLSKVVDFTSDMLTNNEFNQEDLEKEKRVVLEEIIRSKKPSYQDAYFTRLIYPNYMFSGEILGSEESLKDITPLMLKRYVNKNFVGENCYISVVSNLSFEEVVNKFAPYADKIPSKPQNKLSYKGFETDLNNLYFMFVNPNQQTADVKFIIPYKAENAFDNLCKIEFEELLLCDMEGKLYQKLRNENQLCYSASFNNDIIGNVRCKIFEVTTSPSKVNRVIDAVSEVINDLKDNGITENELEDFKTICRSRKAKLPNYKSASANSNFYIYINKTKLYKLRDIFEKSQDYSKAQIDEYFKNVYNNGNLLVSLTGNIDPETVYNMKEIFEKIYPNNTLRDYDENVLVAEQDDEEDIIDEEEIENDELDSDENAFKF